jgi:hypothetical protein
MRTILPVLAIVFLAGPTVIIQAADRVDFNRDVRPILSDNCFFCHGPDKNHREAELRLDVRDEALRSAIVPGKTAGSPLVDRIFSQDQDEVMPPPMTRKVLTAEQKEILKLWIAQGAEYQGHWSYEAPVKADVPEGKNAVDEFVHKRLRELGLSPSSEADRRTLIRRLYFDLLGLPPTPEEVAAFASDPSPSAYSQLVERILRSPHYGERMALGWLDVVRFADTIGYHSDNPRNVWPYRDWVIKSFNDNKPFDRFTQEQIAGDLLPDANQETRIGSAFNRLLLSTEEGGAQAKDYEQRMLTDRVRAIGAAWLGQTTGCAQCHDHKFDPFTMRDFYSLGAFFADIKEPILGAREPGMMVLNDSERQQWNGLQQRLADLQAEFDAPKPELEPRQADWEREALDAMLRGQDWQSIKPTKAVSDKKNVALKLNKDGIVRASVDGKRETRRQSDGTDSYRITLPATDGPITGLRIDALKDKSPGIGLASNGNFVLSEISVVTGHDQKKRIAQASATFQQTNFAASSAIDGIEDQKDNGWAVLGGTDADQSLYLELAEPMPGEAPIDLILTFGWGDHHAIANLRIQATKASPPIRAPSAAVPNSEIAKILEVPSEQRTPLQRTKLATAYRQVAPELTDLRARIGTAEKEKADFEKSAPRCLVSVSDTTKRVVRILPRGNWMDESGEVMKPALPGYLPRPEGSERELTRLDLARWLVSRDNPLTARTVMNRLWKQFFGLGLSKVLDDLGAQGEPPTHPALLDWLACEFMDSGWDMKHMIRVIVNSHTYKQVSTGSEGLVAKDPYNRELARQSPFRIDAELVRDGALSVSGLLVRTIGGPSVKPYQPDGYWENLNFPVRTYPADTGPSQYRRGLYTWWQRSFLHPSMLAFDAPNREECCAERNRSNIPQQALVLLNDPTYVEAARVLASRVLKEGPSNEEQRLEWAWQQVLQRGPTEQERRTILPLLSHRRLEYQADPKAAEALLNVGQSPVDQGIQPAEAAAWTHVCRILLNLHETITRS